MKTYIAAWPAYIWPDQRVERGASRLPQQPPPWWCRTHAGGGADNTAHHRAGHGRVAGQAWSSKTGWRQRRYRRDVARAEAGRLRSVHSSAFAINPALRNHYDESSVCREAVSVPEHHNLAAPARRPSTACLTSSHPRAQPGPLHVCVLRPGNLARRWPPGSLLAMWCVPFLGRRAGHC